MRAMIWESVRLYFLPVTLSWKAVRGHALTREEWDVLAECLYIGFCFGLMGWAWWELGGFN